MNEKPEFVLKNRNYLLLFLGQVVSNLGTFMYNVAISFYVLEITNDNAAIQGLYLMTGGLTFFILSLFGGAIVDRLDKVKIVVRTDLINGVVVVGTGLIIFSGISNTLVLYVLFFTAIVLGINSALFNPAVRSLPPHILKENQLQQSASMTQGMFAVYGILGALLGGLLYDLIPMQWIFIINGLTFISSGISESFIKIKTKPDEDHILTVKQTLIDVWHGIKYVYELKPIFWLVAIASVLNFFTVPMIANGFPYLFKSTLQQGAFAMAIVNSMFSVGVIITSVVLGSIKQKERVSPVITRGLFGMSIGMFVVALMTRFVVYGNISFIIYMVATSISLIVMGLFNGMINIPFGVAIMKTVSKEKLGRVYSVISIISNGLTPIAMGLGGLVIANFGLLILFYVAPVAMLGTAFMAARNKHIQQL